MKDIVRYETCSGGKLNREGVKKLVPLHDFDHATMPSKTARSTLVGFTSSLTPALLTVDALSLLSVAAAAAIKPCVELPECECGLDEGVDAGKVFDVFAHL